MYPHWTQKIVEIDTVRLHYTRTGSGDKPALVLAHGFSDAGLCWLPVAMDLEGEYDVILPDARGHGLSARVHPGENIDAVGDLAGMIKALELVKPVVGGHSMGARVSAQFAARYPELLRALILEDPAWFDPEPPKAPEVKEEPRPNPWMEWLLTLPSLSLEDVMAKCRKDSPNWPEIEVQPWAESKKQFDPTFIQVRSWTQDDWRDVAKAIQCPTLLVTSDSTRGGIVTPAIAAEATALNPLIQVAHIDGAGHNIRRENFPAFMAAVRAFLHSL